MGLAPLRLLPDGWIGPSLPQRTGLLRLPLDATPGNHRRCSDASHYALGLAEPLPLQGRSGLASAASLTLSLSAAWGQASGRRRRSHVPLPDGEGLSLCLSDDQRRPWLLSLCWPPRREDPPRSSPLPPPPPPLQLSLSRSPAAATARSGRAR